MTLAERWNGTSWTVQSTPNPTGAESSHLNGDLVHLRHGVHRRRELHQLVGTTGTSVDAGRALERHRLDDPAHPQPAGRATAILAGVSCTSATACTAVGNYRNSAGKLVTLAERWNGTSWTIQPTPNPTGAPAAASCRGSRARPPRRAPPSGTTQQRPAPR